MLSRVLLWLTLLAVGALTGAALHGPWGAVLGLVLAVVLLLLYDSLLSYRLEAWLRALQLADEAVTGPEHAAPDRGWQGELADRIRHLLRTQQRARVNAERRMEEVLAAMQASPNGLVLLDEQGRIEFCNLTASQHFGLDPQRDLQQYVVNLVRDPAFTAYVAAGDAARTVLVAGSGSGARGQRLSVQMHPYGEGRRMMMSRDVTLLEQAEAMRRDFVANVSHEIRTPLTVLSGFVETLQTLPLEAADQQRYLGLMARQAQRMQTLVDDLLTLSRLEGSPLPDDQGSIGLDALMAQCEHEARSLSAQQGSEDHVLSFEHETGWDLVGSPTELQSALSNLVSNAVRYTPAPGSIEVRWRVREDGWGEFSVQDSGPGIAPEHLPRLTERFYRVDRSRSRETGGTGLGLAIVKHVAQRHGAELRIASEPGQGSRFSLLFPPMRVRRAAALTSA